MDMSTAILSLSESGELQRIHDRWLNTRTCSQKSSDNTDQLHLKSFRGLFLICGITCLAAVFIYFCLIYSKFRRHSPKLSESSAQASSPSVRIRRFLSFVDEKEDSLKSRMKRKHIEMLSRSCREEQQSCNEVREEELDEGHNGNGYFR